MSPPQRLKPFKCTYRLHKRKKRERTTSLMTENNVTNLLEESNQFENYKFKSHLELFALEPSKKDKKWVPQISSLSLNIGKKKSKSKLDCFETEVAFVLFCYFSLVFISLGGCLSTLFLTLATLCTKSHYGSFICTNPS